MAAGQGYFKDGCSWSQIQKPFVYVDGWSFAAAEFQELSLGICRMFYWSRRAHWFLPRFNTRFSEIVSLGEDLSPRARFRQPL